MAKIIFYDCTENDRRQLGALLSSSDHSTEFISEALSPDNVRPDAEAISVFITSPVTAEVIYKMPSLKLIVCRSTGYNNVDLKTAKERNITVCNVPTYGEETVAEYTFMLMLALTRKLIDTLEAVDKAEINQTKLTGIDLAGKTLGILGAGRIGQRVAVMAKAFGMNILAYDPFPNQKKAEEIGYEYRECLDLVKSADILTLHMPYLETNRHFVDDNLFMNCKPGVLFINTARGELVDTNALIRALEDGRVAGAGLDVIEGEELLQIEEEELLLRRSEATREALERSLRLQILTKIPNVIITPHNAFNTVEAINRINESTVSNVNEFFNGGSVNKVG